MVEPHKHDCDVHSEKIKQQEHRLDKIDMILEKIQNRLPVWATFTLGALLAIIGYLVAGFGK